MAGLIGLGGMLALIYGVGFCWRGESWLRTGIKTGAMVLPALAVSMAGLPLLAVVGLWACIAGDYLLSRPGPVMLKAGIGAFALGHVFYVVSFLTLFPMRGADGVFWAVLAGLIGLGLSTEVWLSPRTGALRGAVRGYVVLILAMGVSAALSGGPRLFLLGGALCFIASDLILSTILFLGKGGRLAAFAVWGLYYAAQGLILWGLLHGITG